MGKVEKFQDMEDLNQVVDQDDFEKFKRRIEDDGLLIEIIGKTVSFLFRFLCLLFDLFFLICIPWFLCFIVFQKSKVLV